MKILHIVAGNLSGGAARGAYWLHLALLREGIASTVLTNSRLSDTTSYEEVVSVNTNFWQHIINSLRARIDNLLLKLYPKRTRNIYSLGLIGYQFLKTKEYQEADLVHFHWINNGFISIRDFKKIDKPIIWTLRDMWPFTGGCHYSLDCTKFIEGCGACPQLGSNNKNDLSSFIYRQKRKSISGVTAVGISKWISEQAKMSKLFKADSVTTISNCIDTDIFIPVDKLMAREKLGITTNKKIVLFGATSVKDFYKGFDKLLLSLKFLDPKQYYLCFFGKKLDFSAKELGFEFTEFGYIHDNQMMLTIYSCADVFVAPSIIESFGKTIVESMSCQTPVVCFDATGPKDIIVHKETGYKAKPFCEKDLAIGIEWVCTHKSYDDICLKSRIRAVKLFSLKVIASQYLNLYKNLATVPASAGEDNFDVVSNGLK